MVAAEQFHLVFHVLQARLGLTIYFNLHQAHQSLAETVLQDLILHLDQ
jgi:hypothetical protein